MLQAFSLHTAHSRPHTHTRLHVEFVEFSARPQKPCISFEILLYELLIFLMMTPSSTMTATTMLDDDGDDERVKMAASVQFMWRK